MPTDAAWRQRIEELRSQVAKTEAALARVTRRAMEIEKSLREQMG